VLAAGLAMFMVVGLVQLVTYQYARGAVMAALERGVRTASVAGAGVEDCMAAVSDSLDSVLGGEVGDSVDFGCETDALVMQAWATATVPSWMAGVPDMPFDLEAQARREIEG
jgi:hypothetical protein